MNVNLLTEYFGIIVGISVVAVYQEPALPYITRLFYVFEIAFVVFVIGHTTTKGMQGQFVDRLKLYLLIMAMGFISIIGMAFWGKWQQPFDWQIIPLNVLATPLVAIAIWIILAEISPSLTLAMERYFRKGS